MSGEKVERVWRVGELAAHVAHVLSSLALAQSSGRVREVPDVRTIRYYGTLGLVSKPLGFRGRAALYGWPHVVQLVAIKRLQVKGLSLSEVQEALLGQTEEALEAMAAIPASLREELLSPEPGKSAQAQGGEKAKEGGFPEAQGRKRRSFWKQVPPVVGESSPVLPDPGRDDDGPRQEQHGGGQGALVLQGVVLAEELKLLLESPARALEEDDVEAIRVAAGPLLKVLEARNLLRVQDKGDDS